MGVRFGMTLEPGRMTVFGRTFTDLDHRVAR